MPAISKASPSTKLHRIAKAIQRFMHTAHSLTHRIPPVSRHRLTHRPLHKRPLIPRLAATFLPRPKSGRAIQRTCSPPKKYSDSNDLIIPALCWPCGEIHSLASKVPPRVLTLPRLLHCQGIQSRPGLLRVLARVRSHHVSHESLLLVRHRA